MTNSLQLSFKEWLLVPNFLVAAAFFVLFTGPLDVAAANESILLSATPLSGQAPLTVTFTVTPSNLPSCGNTITKNFGDGPGLSLSDYCAQATNDTLGASTYSHTYNNPGTYLATIKINQTSSNSVSITVTPSVMTPLAEAAAAAQVQVQISALQAQLNSLLAAKAATNESISLTATPLSGVAPLTVTFTAALSNFPSCGNTYVWNFGDSSGGLALAESCALPVTILPSRAIVTSHTYSSPGTYSATLKMNQISSNSVSIAVTPSVMTPLAEAATILQMQAQISALQAQLNSLLAAKAAGSSSNAPAFGGVIGIGAALGSGNTLSSNLAMGASGNSATALQTFLATMGYYSGPITGYFGPLTRGAVIKFQQANGLPDTGYVGPLTRAAIQSSILPTNQ